MEKQDKTSPIADALREFLQLETAGGALLIACVVVAMLTANSPLSGIYAALLDMTVAIQVGALVINKPLLLWVNDGLMAVFFFLILRLRHRFHHEPVHRRPGF